jgi:hypothetical protein
MHTTIAICKTLRARLELTVCPVNNMPVLVSTTS